MNGFDTNVWIYSHDSRDPQKQQIANDLIAMIRPFALPWQVGCEFIAASRKLHGVGFTVAKAWAALDDMQNLASTLLMPGPALWTDARDFQNRFQLSVWDALLVAACIGGGVQTLYSEDFGQIRQIDSLAIINPFTGP